MVVGVFAAGLSAAAPVAYYADQGVEAGIAGLARATWVPGFVRPYLPKPLEQPMPLPRHAIAPMVAPTPSATEPVAPERPAMEARARMVRGVDGKGAATLAAAESLTPIARGQVPGKEGKGTGRLEGDGSRSYPARGEQARGKGYGQPAPENSRSTKSVDGLDDLMMGSVGDGARNAKSKRNTTKEIDAMLKNVQKSEPPPRKPAETAPPPPLTASEIASVMAGVKTRANACGKRFGQSGLAELKLTVGKDGKVADVVLRGKLADSPIGQCITNVARGAAFSRNAGLKFDYRIAVQ